MKYTKSSKNDINKRKILKLCVVLLTFLVMGFYKNTYAANNLDDESSTNDENSQNSMQGVSDSLDFEEYVNKIDEYVKASGLEEIDINSVTQNFLENGKIDNQTILKSLINMFGKEILANLKGAIVVYIIIILMSIITSFDMEEKGDITKIAKLVCFVALSTVMIKNFLEVVAAFKNVVTVLTTIMQIVSPFLLAVLIATGALSTTGIVQPILLFLASLVGFLINYVVIPFFMISVAFNVIYSISENLRISKVSKLFSGSAIWVVGVLFTLFLGVLSLESSVSSSVDSLTVKTTQAAVSNFVPVVGKFFSDSFETVVGATKIIGKTGGVVGIIAIILVAAIPIIKLASIVAIYNILNTLIEPIYADEKVSKYISNFTDVYKNMLGILIGIVILFIISTGIILNLVSKIVTWY